MSRQIGHTLRLLGFLMGVLTANVFAQVSNAPIPNDINPTSLVVSFPANIVSIDGVAVPASGVLPSPLIYFKEAGNRVYLTADANIARDSGNAPLLNQVTLSNFRSLAGGFAVHLVTGSDEGGAGVPCDRETVPCVATGAKRTYIIAWESVQIETQSRPSPVLTTARVGAASGNAPFLSAQLRLNNREFIVRPTGIDANTLFNTFKGDPSKVRVAYEFGPNDLATNFRDQAGSLSAWVVNGNVEGIIVDVGRDLPHRPEDYSVTLEFPAAMLRGHEQPGFAIPPDDEFVKAGKEINVALVGLAPLPTERAKTEFYFENTFSSIVNSTNRKRSNVGLFALHVKPVVGLHFFNLDQEQKRPQWIALRPLLDADVDTQPIKTSEAPNRVVFGADFEWGIAGGQKARNARIQQYIFLNGIRYDSDRDFKTQTLYWHTEFLPQFLNFEQSREQRLRQFRFPNGIRDPKKTRLAPIISSYHVRPSVGYQLGGTMKRGDAPTETISRVFMKFGSAIELKRLFQLSLDNTYYFLENAPRRRNRDYLEARLDFNTGSLFSVDLGSLQSAMTLKFQRGELPPRFKPVNAFSIGFRLFR
ncbi:MAG TPA: hypothetical protein VJR02_16865 [Pyrinomonadaceae bacterium]|nr:hypothetical protein [Pyrinomonadaceae bacterium]